MQRLLWAMQRVLCLKLGDKQCCASETACQHDDIAMCDLCE